MLAQLLHPAGTWARRLRHDCRGAAAIVFAVSLSATLGCAGLATEVALWYVKKRDMQAAADSAAYSAAAALTTSVNPRTQARAMTAHYGYVDDANGVTVTVNNPPASGPYQGNNNAVEVIVQQPQHRLFSALYLNIDPTLKSRAVAIAGAGSACVLALDSGASASTVANGTTNVNLVGCGLVVDSSSSTALTLSGNAAINAQSAAVTGGYATAGGATITVSSPDGVITGAPPLPDPFQDVQVPSYSGCTQSSYNATAGTTVTLSPGVYCNGLSIQGGAAVTLNPGVYIMDRGTFSVAGNATVTGSGVTIVLTSSTGTNYATVSISGGAVINLSAPTSGSTAGLVFFQDQNAPTGVNNSFLGGSTQNITGAIYLPKQELGFAGGSSGTGGGCTLLIADQVDFKGNANLATNCTGTAVPSIVERPRLVE